MVDTKTGEKLSIVVPLHNEERTVEFFYREIKRISPQLNIGLDFYFVDDGSNDRTLSILKKLAGCDQCIHFLSFSRQFGKEAAMFAGLKHADGDYVVVMDVDLQDPPDLLPKMLAGVRSREYDAVATRRTGEGENRIRSWFSKKFYQIMNKISNTEFVNGARDYRVMNRQVVDAVLSLPENQRFSKGIFSWIGFKTKYIPYPYHRRFAGRSSWSFWSLIKYAVEGIVAFSTVPLTVVTMLGCLSSGVATLGMLFIVIRALVKNTSVAGWPSMVTIVLFIGGIQLLSLGIIGRYVAANYLEVKKRPIYLIKEKK